MKASCRFYIRQCKDVEEMRNNENQMFEVYNAFFLKRHIIKEESSLMISLQENVETRISFRRLFFRRDTI